MQLILNIGLKSEIFGDIPVERALTVVHDTYGSIIKWALVNSDTEPTMVADVEARPAAPFAGVSGLAYALGQDCVAAYLPQTGKGELRGPHPDKWGEFNPEYFFTLDGRRLSEVQGV